MTAGWEAVPAALHLDTSVSPAARALYPVLMYLAYRDGARETKIVSASESEIADAFGTSIRSVRRYVGELEKAGWLTVRRETGFPSTYQVETMATRSADVAEEPRPNMPTTLLSTDLDRLTATPYATTSAQALVGEYVDAVRAIGAIPPRQVIGQVARGVKALIDDGFDAEAIRRALALLVERRLHPSTLPSLMIEAQAGGRSRTNGGGQQAFDDALRALEGGTR